MPLLRTACHGALLLGLLAALTEAQGGRGGTNGGKNGGKDGGKHGGAPEWGTRGNNGGGKLDQGPPIEATTACANLGKDAACEFLSPRNHQVKGTCKERKGPGKDQSAAAALHCRPHGPKGHGGPGGPEQQSGNGKGPGHEGPGQDHVRGRNSSIAGCIDKNSEESCSFRPPVNGDQEARGFQGGKQGNLKGKNGGRGWDDRKDDFNDRRGPPGGARPERPGICVPRELTNGDTVNFCRPLPPPEALPVCEALNVDDSCSFTTNGTETHINLKVFTGTHAMAETKGSVLASFFVNGEWTDPELFFTGAEQGEEKSKVFVLSGWPKDVSLTIWSNDAWSFWKISVNDTVILEDPSGEKGSDPYYDESTSSTFADSRYWIEGPPSSQIFDVPHLVTNARRLADTKQQINLRILTATSTAAGTKGTVFVDFLVQDKWIKPELVFNGAETGEEKTQTFALDAWPEKVWIGTNSSDAYSYWKIMINEQAVIEDPTGSIGSQEYEDMGSLEEPSQFWIQSPPSSQSFAIRHRNQPPGARSHEVRGTCQASWWDMLEGTLFCRSGKGFNPTQRPESANHMEPALNVKSTAVVEGDTSEEVKISMLVLNVNYDQLLLNSQLKNAFVTNVQTEIAQTAGEGVYAQHVKVTLAPGSVAVTADIDPPAYISRSFLRKKLELEAATLAQDVGKAVASIPNIQSVATGTISATEPTVEASKLASSAATSDDHSNTTVLAIVAASSGAFAICMALVSCILFKKLRAVKSSNIGVNGTTVAIGRPVQPGETNNVAEGTPVNPVSPDECSLDKPAAKDGVQKAQH